MDSYIKYSVLKVKNAEDIKGTFNYTRTFTFESKLPPRIIGIFDFKGNGQEVNRNKYSVNFTFWSDDRIKVGKYKYLIVKHIVDSQVSSEDYWNELGSLKKPTITQIKCYQYIINNLI